MLRGESYLIGLLGHLSYGLNEGGERSLKISSQNMGLQQEGSYTSYGRRFHKGTTHVKHVDMKQQGMYGELKTDYCFLGK